MSFRRQRSISLGGRYRQVSLYVHQYGLQFLYLPCMPTFIVLLCIDVNCSRKTPAHVEAHCICHDRRAVGHRNERSVHKMLPMRWHDINYSNVGQYIYILYIYICIYICMFHDLGSRGDVWNGFVIDVYHILMMMLCVFSRPYFVALQWQILQIKSRDNSLLRVQTKYFIPLTALC